MRQGNNTEIVVRIDPGAVDIRVNQTNSKSVSKGGISTTTPLPSFIKSLLKFLLKGNEYFQQFKKFLASL